MYPPYKNAYKRLFCSNIKALTRRKNERIYEYFIVIPGPAYKREPGIQK